MDKLTWLTRDSDKRSLYFHFKIKFLILLSLANYWVLIINAFQVFKSLS